jgi:hypothetical protein
MTYKGMLLSTLLISVVSTCFGENNVEQQIQQLKEKRYQKELELSGLGGKISEKEELLRALWQKANEFVNDLMQEKKLTGEESEDFLKNVNREIATFEEYIGLVIKAKKDSKKNLIEELVKGDDKRIDDFDTLKFYSIRSHIEWDLLKIFIEEYEVCLRELIKINYELELLLRDNVIV